MRHPNFNAGPAALPLPVLQKVQQQLVEYPDAGMSVMEMSHRSKTFDAILENAQNGLRQLLEIPENYQILFLQGGASLQFSMVPMNLLQTGQSADYLVSGSWGVKAFKEAQKEGEARIAASTKDAGFRRVPHSDEIELDEAAKYVHLTTNETIEGVQWPHEPETDGIPLVGDMSSDILSRPFSVEKYGLFYAGAQKNIGPSGVTLVVVREDWVEEHPQISTMLDYTTHVKNNSLYNTPNTFGIYIIGLVCEWIENLGGLPKLAERNQEKADLLYSTIDSSEFWCGHAEPDSRSQMNVTWRLPSEELEAKFAAEATKANLIGLKGHRSVGGIRASIYNAVELESVRALVAFMNEFERANG